MTCPSHPPLIWPLNQPRNIGWAAQIMILYSSYPVPFYLLPPSPQYLPQHPILEHPQSRFFPLHGPIKQETKQYCCTFWSLYSLIAIGTIGPNEAFCYSVCSCNLYVFVPFPDNSAPQLFLTIYFMSSCFQPFLHCIHETRNIRLFSSLFSPRPTSLQATDKAFASFLKLCVLSFNKLTPE